jgi:hypothetical protein
MKHSALLVACALMIVLTLASCCCAPVIASAALDSEVHDASFVAMQQQSQSRATQLVG